MANAQYKQSLSGFIWQSALGIGLLLFISFAAIIVAKNLGIEPMYALIFMVCGLLVIFILFRLLFPPTSVQALQDAEYWKEIAENHEQTISNLQATIADAGQINSKGHQLVADLKQDNSTLIAFSADLEQNLGNEKHVIAKYKHSDSIIIRNICSYLNENLRESDSLRNEKKEYQKNYDYLANEKFTMANDFATMNFIRKNFGKGKEIADLLSSHDLINFWAATDSIRKALAAKGIENPNKDKAQ